jgi:multiple sugar transport system permease protein
MPLNAGAPQGGQAAMSVRWMVWPAVLFTVLLVVFPFAYTAALSTQDFVFGQDRKFAGLDNYTRMFTDPEYANAFKLTFLFFFLSLILQLVLGTWLAFAVNRVIWFKGLIRTVLISPFMLPPVVIGMMAIVILDPSLGVANYLLGQAGIAPRLFLAHPEWAIGTFVLIDAWQQTPFVALIVLGGLQSLPARVFEAAEVDGAYGWRRLFYITLPLLGPTLVTAAVLRSVDLLRFFDIIYITTRGGPGNASTTLNILAYNRGFEFLDIGYASAMMISISVVVLGSVLTFARLRRAVAW